MKTAIFGGAFNPVHNGHKKIALECCNFLGCDRLLIVPSKISPHKANDDLVSDFHRLNMCKLCFADIKNCVVSDIEINRDTISYTIFTLRELKKMYPNDELFLICGSDMFLTLLKWKDPKEIFSLCTICAFMRDNQSIDEMYEYKALIEKEGANVVICESVIPPFSSTQIRKMIKSGVYDERLLPPNVLDYIRNNKLYI